MPIPINLVFEDDLSEFVMTQIIWAFDEKFYIGHTYNGRGFGYIKTHINGFNQAAISTPFFVLADLDNHHCPIALIDNWMQRQKNENLIFRIAVREVESWILADVDGFSTFLGISSRYFPQNPDFERDPKKTLIELVKKSNKRKIKNDIVPINDNAKIGPNYNGALMEFVFEEWDVFRAAGRSESLARAYSCLERYNYIPPLG